MDTAQIVQLLKETALSEATRSNPWIWPIAEIDFQRIYRPYSFYPVASYAEELMRFRDWIRARLAWIDGHIDAYPN